MADVIVGDAGTEWASLAKNTAVTTVAGASVTVTNTAVLRPQGWTSTNHTQFDGRYLVVRMVESGTQVDTVATVKAGVVGGTPANTAVYGDLALAAATDGLDRLMVLELARFQQADGTVRIEVSGTAGGALTFSYYVIGSGV